MTLRKNQVISTPIKDKGRPTHKSYEKSYQAGDILNSQGKIRIKLNKRTKAVNSKLNQHPGGISPLSKMRIKNVQQSGRKKDPL